MEELRQSNEDYTVISKIKWTYSLDLRDAYRQCCHLAALLKQHESDNNEIAIVQLMASIGLTPEHRFAIYGLAERYAQATDK